MIKTVRIRQVVLDEENPRLAAGSDDQRVSINRIIALASGKLFNLARDIAEQGTTNPSELPILIKHPTTANKYVVLEGNRRFAALALLSNPSLADDANEVAKYTRIAKGKSFPDKLSCVIVDSRRDAQHWIEIKHTGENGGIGVSPWSSEQKNRFKRRKATHIDRAAAFCDAIVDAYPDDDDLLDKVHEVRSERPTTLGRLLADPHVRSSFGFEFVNGELHFWYPTEVMRAGIFKLFDDLSGENAITVTELKNKKHRQEYVTKAAPLLPSPADRLTESAIPSPAVDSSDKGADDGVDEGGDPDLDEPASTGLDLDDQAGDSDDVPDPADDEDFSSSPNGNESSDGTGGSSSDPASDADAPPADISKRRREPQQEKVIFSGLKLNNLNLRTSKILKSAQSISIEDNPELAAVMLRVVVDLAVTDASEIMKWSKNQEKLKDRIGVVLRKIDTTNKDPLLERARMHVAENGLMGIRTMHAYIHSPHFSPSLYEIRGLSHDFRPVLERLNEFILKNRPST